MYVRFTTKFTNEDGQEEKGIFNALAFIRDHQFTKDEDVKELKMLTKWFNNYLNEPTRLSNANSKKVAPISLSWFKDSANIDIKKIQDLRVILHKYEIITEMVTTKNPGYIVYEDKYQVSAVPFKSHRNKVS